MVKAVPISPVQRGVHDGSVFAEHPDALDPLLASKGFDNLQHVFPVVEQHAETGGTLHGFAEAIPANFHPGQESLSEIVNVEKLRFRWTGAG